MEQKDKIKVLVIEPEKEPYAKFIENTLKSLQDEVGGCIQPFILGRIRLQ